MKESHPSFNTLISLVSLLFLPSLTSPQSCLKSCGAFPLRYPFGSGPGCGDPRFLAHVTCSSQQALTLTTRTGSYPITSIDYNSHLMHISDPSMSTCPCSQPCRGFSLDWDAPFAFHDSNVFVLLDCSTTSSPIYLGKNTSSSSPVPLCDSEGAAVCSLLLSCRAISTHSTPISSCCVYAPVDLGPSFEMDLEKLQCSSYSGFYSHRGSDPQNWEYGVALKYKFNVDNELTSSCARCERGNGVCGYNGAYNFICNCPGGVNTTSDCFLGMDWNAAGSRLVPWKVGVLFIFCCFTFSFVSVGVLV